MGGKVDRKTMMILKFLMYRVHNLVTDSAGRKVFLKSFDGVIEDVFGYKNLGSKLNECYTDQDLLIVVTDFGLKNLMSICNTPKVYSAVADMITIDQRIKDLKRYFKKMEKKDKKKDKDFVKEFNYLVDLYKKGLKQLRKYFNIKASGKSYKRRYNAIQEFVDPGREYSLFDNSDFIYGDDMYSDGDDEYEDGDAFNQFLNRFDVSDNHSSSRRNRRTYGQSLDIEPDEEEEFDATDEDFAQLTEMVAEIAGDIIKEEISPIRGDIEKLARAFEHVINTDPKVKGTPKPSNNDTIGPQILKISEIVNKVVGNQEALEKRMSLNMQNVGQNLNKIASSVQKLSDVVFDDQNNGSDIVFEGSDCYLKKPSDENEVTDIEISVKTEISNTGDGTLIDMQLNRHPDMLFEVNNNELSQSQSISLSREDMINEFNKGNSNQEINPK